MATAKATTESACDTEAPGNCCQRQVSQTSQPRWRATVSCNSGPASRRAAGAARKKSQPYTAVAAPYSPSSSRGTRGAMRSIGEGAPRGPRGVCRIVALTWPPLGCGATATQRPRAAAAKAVDPVVLCRPEMANAVVVGMQWGDEGKGKIVDLLC